VDPGGGDADYINLPLNEAQYKAFVAALLAHPEMASGHWPAELFHPMTGSRREVRNYA
jgi:folate-dependent tRNA-U54 methylase TrmFO/GidA